MEKVLVVDDELDISILITKHLERKGFSAEFALTKKEALVKIDERKYDLVVVDLNLTDGSGFDIIKHIKSKDCDCNIIAISAFDNEAEKAIKMGASIFISKPFKIGVIDKTLRTLDQ